MPLIRIFAGLWLIIFFACSRESSTPSVPCSRIVSTAPNITELLFELGLGPRIVGVTRYCTWPPETEHIAKVGGWYDPSPEAIVALKPDTLFYLPEQQQVADTVQKSGITPVALAAKTIDDVTIAAQRIGAYCHCEQSAERFAARFSEALEQATVKKSDNPRPRVLLVIGRSPETGPIGTLFVAGKGSFHDALLQRAGGTNACDLFLPYPRVSAEGVITMNPDIIIELSADKANAPISPDDWRRLDTVTAVKNGRIHRLEGDRFFIPSPRIPLIIKELVHTIHPENLP